LKIRQKRVGGVAAQFAAAAFVCLLCLLCFELFALTVSSSDVFVRHDAPGEIRVTAPHLHFLVGKSLERLQDGAQVPFDFQLSVSAGARSAVVARAVERFTVSYDVWQQKFSVVRLRDFRKSPLLSSAAAEAWCIENILVPAGAVPADKDLWAHLEIRSVEQHDQPSAWSNSGISVTTLIELFSRPARPQQDRWSLETAPFRLADLQAPAPKS
jgi:hypothetical protein